MAYPKSDIDWQPYRSVITRLYRDDKKTLKEVQWLLRSTYNFTATEKMWKRRITLWGLDKKHKKHEVLEIIRLQARRAAQGKKSAFTLRGQVVDMDDIHRYLKRKKLLCQEGDCLSPPRSRAFKPMHSQISDLMCRTPSPGPLNGDPGVILDENESFYLSLNQYLLASIESKAWVLNERSGVLESSVSASDRSLGLLDTILLGADRYKDGDYLNAMQHWRLASVQLEAALRPWDYHSLLELIGGIAELVDSDVTVANMFLHHLRQLAAVLMKSASPQRSVLEWLSRLDSSVFNHLVLFTMRSCLPIFRARLPQHPDFFLCLEAELAYWETDEGVWHYSPDLYARMEARLQPDQSSSTRLLWAAEGLIAALRGSEMFEEAMSLSHLHIERLQSLPQDYHVVGLLFWAWDGLAQAQHSHGRDIEARLSCLQATEAYEKLMQQSCYEHKGRLCRRMPEVLNDLVSLESSIGLVVEAEAHKRQLTVLVAALDREVQERLASKEL